MTNAVVEPSLILKVTAPRVAKELIARPRLSLDSPQFRNEQIILVLAAPGFGKTSQAAHWRREHLARGAAIAWVSAQEQDEPGRLLHALILAVRIGAGRPNFGHALSELAQAPGLDGITTWLAEVAQSALNLVLILDEADRLPKASRAVLTYLLHNAPPNLRIIVAARPNCDLDVDELIAYGQCRLISAEALRFTIEETIDLVRYRTQGQATDDSAARLHDMTEGWPLGIQLALSLSPGAGAFLASFSGPERMDLGLRQRFVGKLLGSLSHADLAFLVRISAPDHLHVGLCEALCVDEDVSERLARLVRDTPLFVVGEQGDWLRLHNLARVELRRRFAELPTGEQSAIHKRAADWLAGHGLIEAAAQHAFSAGDTEQAYALAEQSLYESIVRNGRQSVVLEWLARLPEVELNRRPRILMAAAWSLAVSERHHEAGHYVSRILTGSAVDDPLRCECALILSGAAVFADDPDRFAELHDPWSERPPLTDPRLLRVHANRAALRALLEGDPALARLRQQQALFGSAGNEPDHIERWGAFLVALTYLWEGQAAEAERHIRPVLAQTEADLGRRNPFAAMLAALLAAAVWERDNGDEAVALLANRLDVLERAGLPEAVMLGFRTLARVAVAQGTEQRALELLGALHAHGINRNLPRLRIVSLSDQARIHARRFRQDSCVDLCRQIDELMAVSAMPHGRLWRRSVDIWCDMARAYTALARKDWRTAIGVLARAGAQAQSLRMGRVYIEALALRAFALERCGEKADHLRQEATGLAAVYGLRRVLRDAHPDLGEGAEVSSVTNVLSVAATPRTRLPGPSVLTPKEREVLELLARNLSNKEIGLALQVGEETIKWHLKNLFAKLDAATRKQVVQRARVLGLIASNP